MILTEDTYKTVVGNAETIIRERSSKFLALSYHVTSADEVREIMEPLRKKFYDATHHCYAYRIGPKGEEWRNRSVQQRADRTTLRFCKWLKKQEELKGILCGHCHFYFKSQFSPTATQYTVGAGYKGNGYIVHIK